jgi:hypothetical protein
MPLKPDYSNTPHDPRIDAFRDAVAALELDGRIVGYLATRIEPVAEARVGHWWWTRWETPREVVTWLQTRTVPDSPLPEFDDGVDIFGDFLVELESGLMEVVDHRQNDDDWDERKVFEYRLIWLSDSEYEEAWDRYGFADTHIV